jgi:glycosyltransferase involved in cell wall biosynthesis
MVLALADLCIVVASNDESCLNRNLLASPMVKAGVRVHVEREAPSAAVAYNRGIASTSEPLIVFAHQDVWFPEGWEKRLEKAMFELDQLDPDWALAAPFGMSGDGVHLGDVWSTSLGRRVGRAVREPTPVRSFDELVIVMKRASGLRFDEELPLWHFYGTDIVLSAINIGKGAYAIDAPVIHNDGFKGRLGPDFTEGYDFLRRKWRDQLPVRTSILWVSATRLPLCLYQLRAWRSVDRRRKVAMDNSAEPTHFAGLSGLEQLE